MYKDTLQNRNADVGLKLLQNSFLSVFFLKGFGKCVLLRKSASSYDDLFMFVIFQKKILSFEKQRKFQNS